jgi:hypothetical protein
MEVQFVGILTMTRIKGSMAEIWLQMGATTPPSSPIKIKKKKKGGEK